MYQSKEIKKNRTGADDFDLCFWVIFEDFSQSFISGLEIWHCLHLILGFSKYSQNFNSLDRS